MMTRFPRLLDDTGQEVRRIVPVDLSVTETKTPLSTADMTILRTEDIPARSYVELFVPGRSCGIYRTRKPEGVYGRNQRKKIRLEHAICEVGDWIIPVKINESVISFPAAISLVWSYYRGTKWQLGSIEADDDVICNINTGNVLSAAISLVSQVPQYMMAFDYSTSPWTVNIVKMDDDITAEGRLSRNIESVTVKYDDSKMFTRVYLDGLPTVEDELIGHLDADTITEYGVIETLLPEGDYTANEATLVASQYLEQHKQPALSVQIGGMDFSEITGESLDRVEIGKLYRLAVQDIEDPVEQHVTTLKWKNVFRNCAVTINLSEEESTATKIIHEQGATQVASSSLANSREQEYRQDSVRKAATGSLSITVSDYTSPETFDITFTSPLGTVNYAVLLTPDNEASNDTILLAGFDYGISKKKTTGFSVTVAIPTIPTGATTIHLRWFAMAK